MKTIKSFIKACLRCLGIGTYSLKHSMRHNMAEALDHLRRMPFDPKTVIDVGVAYGTKDLYEKFPRANHLLIEPLEEYKSVLESIAQRYQAQYELAAAGSQAGEIEINVHPDLSGSSLLKETEGAVVDGTSRKVKMVTIDEVCQRRKLPGPYLLKIDAQGAELEVLAGALKTLADTEAIVLEVSFLQFYKSGPQFYEVVAWMKAHGFVAYDLFGGQKRPLDGALAQIDMMFVKENGFLRQQHAYATPEQRSKHTRRVSAENPKH